MNDYSAALIDARKQLANAEAAAALHDWAGAINFSASANIALLAMTESLLALQRAQNAQRAS